MPGRVLSRPAKGLMRPTLSCRRLACTHEQCNVQHLTMANSSRFRSSHCIFLLLEVALLCSQTARSEPELNELLDLSLEQLTDVTISSGTLSRVTTLQLTPAAVTTITARDIQLSNARDLDELLDIYVPGFQYMNKAQAPMIGIRGIINDRNNKVLLLLNGRNMNIKGADGGAITERLFTMLGDIRKIEVIRSPGSSVHGPGAIAGVISIETFSGSDFNDLELTFRGGTIEEFASGEIKYGKKFNNDLSLFAYYGLDDYHGASRDDSRLIVSHDFTSTNGTQIAAGSSVDIPGVNRYRRSYRDRIRHKAYVELTGPEFDVWARYTRGGQHGQSSPASFARLDDEFLFNHGTGYQQFTLFSSYLHTVTDSLKIEAQASYDLSDVQIGYNIHHWREDEYLAGLRAYITPTDNQRITLGSEFSHEVFGKRSLFVSEAPSDINNDIPLGTHWNTKMYSFFGEQIWHITPHWTTITGARADKHTYTPWMWSPRFALIHTPNDSNTLKLLVTRSVRRPEDADLFRANQGDGNVRGHVERIVQYEARLERQHTESLWLAGSLYYNNHRIVTWNPVAFLTDDIGITKAYGVDLEASLKSPKTELTFSYSFAKLHDFKNSAGVDRQGVSSEPYGYGDDFLNWSNHSTKLTLSYRFSGAWTGSASFRAYWGYPGSVDFADYNEEVLGSDLSFALYDNSKHAFKNSFRFNLGIEYRPSRRLSIALHGYNLLGTFDNDLNKRNTYSATGQYRQEPVSAVVSVTYRP